MPWLDIYRLKRGGAARTVSCASIMNLRGPGAMRKMLENFSADRRGNITLIFTLVFPVVLMLAGFSLDYGMAMVQQKRLQSAVDAGAIAAAKEVNLADRTSDELKFIAESTVFANLKDGAVKPTMSFSVSTTEPVVLLTAVQKAKTFFGGIYGNKIDTVTAHAEAIVVGSTRICVLALDNSASGAVSAEVSARLTGNGCAVFSNSTSSQSITAKNSASMKAALVCAAGGVSGQERIEPEPLTDCPNTPDPLADRAAPPIGACKESWLQISTSITLSPGVYCGGFEIYSGAQVTLNPGVYIIKDGPLIVSGNGSLEGENVGFYLTGSKAVVKFTSDSSISLTAPKDGPLAGMIFFEDAARKTSGTHYITSNDARLLLGTIYLPASKLVIDANAPVADQSAYTAIVVRTLKLYDGPHLILNTNYGATDIPVPAGITGIGNKVALIK